MKKVAMSVLAITVVGGSLHAQQPRVFQSDGATPSFEGPAEEAPDALLKIFSNLGSATKAYNDTIFWYVVGPKNTVGDPQQFFAMAFTPKANAHVQQARVAVQYAGSGAKQVNISLYTDHAGAPGALLAGPVTVKSLSTFPSCCKLAVANFTVSVPVTAGTQYWIVADTPTSGPGSNFVGGWAWVYPTDFHAYNPGSGWSSIQGNDEPAGAVYGTIP